MLPRLTLNMFLQVVNFSQNKVGLGYILKSQFKKKLFLYFEENESTRCKLKIYTLQKRSLMTSRKEKWSGNNGKIKFLSTKNNNRELRAEKISEPITHKASKQYTIVFGKMKTIFITPKYSRDDFLFMRSNLLSCVKFFPLMVSKIYKWRVFSCGEEASGN